MEKAGTGSGVVRGVGTVRDKDGNVKGEFPFEGTTDLTEEELRRRLQEEDPNKSDKQDEGK
jgi:hypothetical protein